MFDQWCTRSSATYPAELARGGFSSADVNAVILYVLCGSGVRFKRLFYSVLLEELISNSYRCVLLSTKCQESPLNVSEIE